MRGQACLACTLPNCGELAGSNLSACGEFPELLLSECAATCGTCSYRTLVAEQMSCDDTHAECANWAKAGECDANPKYMLQSCTTSCGVCEQKMRGCARESGLSGAADSSAARCPPHVARRGRPVGAARGRPDAASPCARGRRALHWEWRVSVASSGSRQLRLLWQQ